MIMIIKALVTVLLFSCTALIASEPSEGEEAVVVAAHSKKRKHEAEPVKNEHITSFDITDDFYLKNVDFIVHFPALQRLTLENCPQLKDSYHWISCLTQLTHLTLNNVKLTTLVHLSGLTSLKFLNVDNNSFTTIKGIEKLSKLRNLSLFGNLKLESFNMISGLTKLRKLNMGNVFDEPVFDDVPSSSLVAALNLEFLLSLTKLTTLKLAGSGYIHSFAVLSKLPKLKSLDVSYIFDIRDVAAFNDFPALTTLTARECPSILGLSPRIKIIN